MSWRAANFSSSGMRAMLPSSFMISQITPAGLSPAMRARSTAASVWPRRASTPPSSARSVCSRPGRIRSPARVPSAIATAMVRARSCADMPEATPSRASIGVANAVPKRVELPRSSAISDRPSSRMRSSVSASDTSPRAWVAMKLIASGVARSAATNRSPSFSRSSSSTRISMRPLRTSGRICSTIEFAGAFGPLIACGIVPLNRRPDHERG